MMMMPNRLVRWVLFPSYVCVPRLSAGEDIEGLERLAVATDEGEVEGWFLPADGAAAKRPLVIFAHGNGELIDDWPEVLAPYRRMGVSLLLPEYRGYGRSAGSPTEDSIVGDYVRFYDEVKVRPDVDASRIIFHGRSLGGGVVCGLARQRVPAGMILESTFTSVADVADRWLVPRKLIVDRFESSDVVRELELPILIFHGRRDKVIPHQHGEALQQCARQARLVSYDCDHNDLPRDEQGFWAEIRSYLATMDAISA